MFVWIVTISPEDKYFERNLENISEHLINTGQVSIGFKDGSRHLVRESIRLLKYRDSWRSDLDNTVLHVDGHDIPFKTVQEIHVAASLR